MSEPQPEVLDYLREQFARLHVRFDAVDRTLAEHGRRLVAVERHGAALRRDAAEDAASVVDVRERMDSIDERVARIERRLDLADAG